MYSVFLALITLLILYGMDHCTLVLWHGSYRMVTVLTLYMIGLGLLCFLNCLLCFGAMLQYSSYYAQIMLQKVT